MKKSQLLQNDTEMFSSPADNESAALMQIMAW